MAHLFKFCLLAIAISFGVLALNNGLGKTPQMGWNSWNAYHCDINETIIRQTAQAMISTGLFAAGYHYLNLDDCWAYDRLSNGTIQPDPTTFPSGFYNLSDFIHSQGLMFGVYSDAGTETCAGRPGSLGHEKNDANQYASWGVDYLKYDNCHNLEIPPKLRYPIMRNALNATGKQIFYSMCEWGVDDPWLWAAPVGNSWRVHGDIQDNWLSLVSIIETMATISNYSAPGGWNDPDMLEVGNGGMTTIEYQTHFAFWAYLKAPLIVGTDIMNIEEEDLEILLNDEIIAINQDPLGVSVWRVGNFNNGEQQVWAGPLSGGAVAVLLFNPSNATAVITAPFSILGIQGSADFRDLYLHEDLGTFNNEFSGEVLAHGVLALKATPNSSENSFLSIDSQLEIQSEQAYL